jgi:flagellar secretion chaperone FliS
MLNSAHLQQRAYGQYQRVQAETATPGQLVLMLYQGCIRFAQRGRVALEAGDNESARVHLLRAQDIVAELMGSLNLEAGDLAGNLLRLYEYLHRRLVHANIRHDASAALEVEELVRSLLPAWEEAIRQQPGAPKPAAPAALAGYASGTSTPATPPAPAARSGVSYSG